MSVVQRVGARLRRGQIDRRLRLQVGRVERYVAGVRRDRAADEAPVLFFNASTRIHRPSLNAAFQRLASWAVELDGLTVRQVVCRAGMVQCILGVNRRDPRALPPCSRCRAMTDRLYPPRRTAPVVLHPEELSRAEASLPAGPLQALIDWRFDGLPLGELVLPGLRWTLRRHDLENSDATCLLMRRFLLSAASLAGRFAALLDSTAPRAVVVFNGVFFPEAILRRLAQARGIPVVTHEVGLRPYSAFFSHAHATFREPDFPASPELTAEQEARLDAYLEDRFAGRFSMAGIRFWPEVQGLPRELTEKAAGFRQVVAVFTNVIFDTSQIHANTHFETMFDWLDDLGAVIRARPDTLFVVRAHPDEDRPGKQSEQSVAEWVVRSGLNRLDNVVFYGPSEYVTSYELIRRAKFVMVYNSSIGLEASILGAPVLCAGRARYTQGSTVFYPDSSDEYRRLLDRFLAAKSIAVPPKHARRARIFLYDELYRASLDLSEFLEAYPGAPGMVTLKAFDPARLAENEALGVIVRGIRDGVSFSLP